MSDDEPPHASAAMSEAVRASAADMGVGSGPGGGEAPWEQVYECVAMAKLPMLRGREGGGRGGI